MFYYFLVALLVIALLVVGMYSFAGRRKARSNAANSDAEPTEAIKRGRFMNK